ncbi:MAG: hypothetical protein KJ944_17335 [Alphaproteobacteria bacterium]|nr:hypothetical protein [Alphaproteobacteria bacterium]MBU1559645.1 hypothetical protein [Alphaproteobacteria bacterium]MBU2304356.1 hypothetical protein [Alphaproteobacteria bacterium]MBU2367141.1 hypothetical protein [Alphaproteobacteria bacterium]
MIHSGNLSHSAGPDFRKDATLDRLAERFNVAQFVSFSPSASGPRQEYCRLSGLPANHRFTTTEEAVQALFERSGEGTVNIRTFSEASSQSREFLYALQDAETVLDALARFSSEGSFAIVNETIDVSDGGVSGVILDDIVEFRPDATPRGVEREGFATLPAAWADAAFRTVFGFGPELAHGAAARLEFSLHPAPRGYRQSHVLYWEFGAHESLPGTRVDVRWPNDFSRMMGDKAFGLLVAHLAGFPVPRSTVIGRRLAPFVFGTPTGSKEIWTRTCPVEQVPGKFTTARGWLDPFALLSREDPDSTSIVSVLAQEAVPAVWSGAAVQGADGILYVEGASGTGEEFMQGTTPPMTLPDAVVAMVRATHARLVAALGDVRFEWAFDGQQVWVMQLHRGASRSAGSVIVPGEADEWAVFDVSEGLEALRLRMQSLPTGHGLLLRGEVGLTSHVADVARKAGVPTRMTRADEA